MSVKVEFAELHIDKGAPEAVPVTGMPVHVTGGDQINAKPDTGKIVFVRVTVLLLLVPATVPVQVFVAFLLL